MFVVETKGNKYICKSFRAKPREGGGRLLLLTGVQDHVGSTYAGELGPDETFTVSNAKGAK